MYNKRTYHLKLVVILIFNFIPAIFSRITSMNDLLLLCDYWLRYFWKSLKTQESVSAHYNGLNVTITRQGAKSRYKWYLLRLILNIRDGSCSRIKSKLFTVFFKLGETTRKIERIKEMDSVRYLGIWLDTKLNFNDYFNKIYRRLTFWLYDMKKIKNFLYFETMKLLYYSFSTLIYNIVQHA